MKEQVEIGYVFKTHGYRGDVKIRIYEHYELNMKRLNVIFLDDGNERLPYFTESIQHTHANEFIVHLESISNKETAVLLKGNKIFTDASMVSIISNKEEHPSYNGYEVFDKALGLIGHVKEVLTYPQQLMLSVMKDGKQILIPLRDELIHERLDEEKRITFDLPEGFLDL